MDTRYEQFNELTFEAYIKSAIDKAVLKARAKQAARREKEQPLSMLSEAVLYTLSTGETENERAEMDCEAFDVRGIRIAGHPVTLSFAAEPDTTVAQRVRNCLIDSYIRQNAPGHRAA